MGRTSCYSLDGSVEATNNEVAARLMKHRALLTIDIYKSIDMKIGIDRDLLAQALELLADLASLDNRGGDYRQSTMTAGVEIVCTTVGLRTLQIRVWKTGAL